MACTATVTTIGGAPVDGGTVALSAVGAGEFLTPSCTLRRGRCSPTLSIAPNSLLGPAGVTATVMKALPYLSSSASTTFDVVPRAADLQVRQVGRPEPGGKARFTIAVRNLGPVAAHVVQVSELLSAASALRAQGDPSRRLCLP